MARTKKQIVPECREALHCMKYEIAAELGLPVGKTRNAVNGHPDVEFATELGSTGTISAPMKNEYWGNIASRDTGAVGGAITARLIQKAQQTLLGTL